MSAGFKELTVVNSMGNDEVSRQFSSEVGGVFKLSLQRGAEVDGQPVEGRALHVAGTA